MSHPTTKTQTGNTKNENTLYDKAWRKFKWAICQKALVIPQPGQFTPINRLNMQITGPPAIYLQGIPSKITTPVIYMNNRIRNQSRFLKLMINLFLYSRLAIAKYRLFKP
jgi:hypothetical protein